MLMMPKRNIGLTSLLYALLGYRRAFSSTSNREADLSNGMNCWEYSIIHIVTSRSSASSLRGTELILLVE
jgi:hypothetical protein